MNSTKEIQQQIYVLGRETYRTGDDDLRDYSGGDGFRNGYKEAISLAKTLHPVPSDYDNSDDDFYDWHDDELSKTMNFFDDGFQAALREAKADIERFAIEDHERELADNNVHFQKVVAKAKEVLGPELKAFRHAGGSYYIIRGNEYNKCDDNYFKIRISDHEAGCAPDMNFVGHNFKKLCEKAIAELGSIP